MVQPIHYSQQIPITTEMGIIIVTFPHEHDHFFPELPAVDLNVELGPFATVPAIFYGVPKPILGGAQ